jgi:cell division transport system permease protein
MSNFKRALHFALVDSNRNRSVSLAAVFVLAVIVAVITGLFFMRGVSNYLISEVENKIDVTAYFKNDASEQDILAIKKQIEKDSAMIKRVEYISREDALTDFNQKHKDNPVFSQALQEVGDNPFLPSLNIVTNGEAKEYEKVSSLLQSEQYKDLVEKVDFYQKKEIIEKVFAIVSGVNTFSFIFGLIVILIAMLVVFNTIKLIIKLAEDEISTMRVIGATNWFIKAPFVIEGTLFGLVAFVICFVATLLLSYFFSHAVSVMVPGFNLFGYFLSHFFMLVFLQLVAGAGLGALTSLIVVNKYLKV